MAGPPDPNELAAFLAAIRQHESGGDYKAYNAGGGASGAYQYIQSTWSSNAMAAGYGQYAGGPASDAPAQVQDAVAAYNATQLWKEYGSWRCAAEAWYYPAWACTAQANQVPYPSAGNTITVADYGQRIVDSMAGHVNAANTGTGAGAGTTQSTDTATSAQAVKTTSAAGCPAFVWKSQGGGWESHIPIIGGGISAAEITAHNIGAMFCRLTSLQWWERVAVFAGGGLLVIIGIAVFVSTTKTGRKAVSEAEQVAPLLAAA